MGLRLDRPLYSLTTHDENLTAQHIWEYESLGGIKENNNPVPAPIAVLLAIIVTTAFMLTFPLWGQRPTAALYADYVDLLNTSEVQQVLNNKDLTPHQADDQAMKLIEDRLSHFPSPYAFQRKQHIMTMDHLRYLAPKISKLRESGADMEQYSIIGPNIVRQNFFRLVDGKVVAKQPWWDAGYTIDIFYVIYFFSVVFCLIKGLPPTSWEPDHSKAH